MSKENSKETYYRVYLTDEQINYLCTGLNWYGQYSGSGDEEIYEELMEECVEAFEEGGWEQPE
jgi:hypothetical protein